MDINSFKDYVRQTLGQADGCAGVDVELSDGQIEMALRTAQEWFNAYVGLFKEATFELVAGISEYNLTAVSPRIDLVSKIYFPLSGMNIDFSKLYPGFLDIQGIPYGATSQTGSAAKPMTTMYQSTQNMDSWARMVSGELSWDLIVDRMVEPTTRTLRIVPTPQISGLCIYLYRVDPTDIKLKYYSPRDLFMVRDYAMAKCKYTLGRIRGKVSSISTAGGDKNLDGEALISESKEEIQDLETKILSYQGSILPFLG